jgi:uncharacterized protein DUF1572
MSMNTLVKSIEAEYRRYKALAEGALAQVADDALSVPGPNGGNSLAVIGGHVAGNLRSLFTEFLTSDGEKPWRQRDEEFQARSVSRADLLAKWEAGWQALFTALASLTDADLGRTTTIRRQPLAVHEALLRSLAHVSYHVGQIVYVARVLCGPGWRYLSIPPGQSAAYNANPGSEKPAAAVDFILRRESSPGN